jgi:hypothetical protein
MPVKLHELFSLERQRLFLTRRCLAWIMAELVTITGIGKELQIDTNWV